MSKPFMLKFFLAVAIIPPDVDQPAGQSASGLFRSVVGILKLLKIFFRRNYLVFMSLASLTRLFSVLSNVKH